MTSERPNPGDFIDLFYSRDDKTDTFRVAHWDGEICVMTSGHSFRWSDTRGISL